ncbi:MAG: GIDE domain-containing protein [Halorientalis sp.]
MAELPLSVLGLLALMVLVGVGMVVLGLFRLRIILRMYRIGTSDIASLTPGLGGVEGTAKEHQSTVTAPLSESACLAYSVEIEHYHHSSEHSDWNTVHTASDGEQFVVEDESSEVTVDPTACDLRTDASIEDVIEGVPSMPAAFEEYLETENVSRTGKNRFTEKRVDPGQDIYVFGPAVSDPESQTPYTFTLTSSDTGKPVPAEVNGVRDWLRTYWQKSTSPLIIGPQNQFGVSLYYLIGSVFCIVFGVGFAGIPILGYLH